MTLNVIDGTTPSLKPLDAQVQVFKTLTHPARIAILNLLRDGEHCVCHMEAFLGFRQAYISQQLAVLREAELIQDRRDGWNIYYRVTNPQIYVVLDAASQLTGQPTTGTAKPETTCPCPHCNPKE